MDMMDKSKFLNKMVIGNILKKIKPAGSKSVRCPSCGGEWNRLTERGVCYDCDPVEQDLKRKCDEGKCNEC